MRILIIGDGVAGHTAAVELRERKPNADIIILSDESYPFYDRVGLKKLIEGEMDYEDLIKADKDFYDSRDIELNLNTKVRSLDTEENIVSTESGEFEYDKLLIAAGGSLKRLDMENSDKDNVFYFWNLEDAREMNDYVEEGAESGSDRWRISRSRDGLYLEEERIER